MQKGAQAMEDGRAFDARRVLDKLGIGLFVIDREGNNIYLNEAAMQEFPDSRTGRRDYRRDAEQGRIDHSITQMVFAEKRQITMANTIRGEDGSVIRLLGVSTPLFDESGEVEYVISVGMQLDRFREGLVQAWIDGNAREVIHSERVSAGTPPPLIYESKIMAEIVELARRVARADISVLITGESGTGKGALARYIHSISARRHKELVEINCAAVPENLLESELFGYEKGAFTGALNAGKPGLMEMADGGTLFLDEIDSIPFHLQGKLLKAIEDKRVQRVGALSPRAVDFRLITASNSDLERLVEEGRFRKDLYYRICVLPLHIPPLRDRPEDVAALSKHFVKQFLQEHSIPKVLSPEGYRKLLAHSWPGNVRELKNVIERMVLIGDPELIEVSDPLLPGALGTESGHSLKEAMEAYEKSIISQTLSRFGLSQAAAFLQVDPSTLTRKKNKYGL